ncbi:hypothetical protein C7T94_08915 [Pedobacter yulinensis]|uniref:ABC transporter domain-containing protein n=1 Tax=Pedobacter yulinensis TaxID=2126353 RepID=A0A2T3HK16_9SPHI|nr:ATP-binding cassette domain-containing protein [Pedobacter yulinensis]PST82759.1 hypothetical protein C7T94_08915 [Pedobacter yulinensis]
MSLVVKSLSYLHPDKEPVFENLSFAIGNGEHVAIVGSNGAGKSTLLALAAGIFRPAAGEVITPDRLWLVPQQLGSYYHQTVAAVLAIEPKLQALGAILSGDAGQEHFDVLQNDWEIEEKLHLALQTWGLGHLSAGTLMAALSGGEKTKVFLAGMALFDPALILLDEPTNHLDLHSREQLCHFLQTTRATVVMVSHDRRLLNYADKTFELDRSAIEMYGGNYDFYAQQKMIQTAALQAQEAAHEKTLRQTQERSRHLAAQRQKKEARGRAEGKSGSLPRIIAGGLKSKAEQTTARSAELAREKSTAVAAGLQRVRAQLSQLQVLRIDLGASTLHPGKVLVDAKDLVLAMANARSGHHSASSCVRACACAYRAVTVRAKPPCSTC